MTLQNKGFSALAIITICLVGISFLIKEAKPGVTPLILAGVGLQSMVVYAALVWALPRSNRTFFSIFVGDAMLRLTGLGIAVLYLLSQDIPYTMPLLSMAFGYLLLSLVQIPFLSRYR